MFDWNGWSSLSCQCDSFETTKSMPVYMTNSHQFYILLVGYIPTVEVCWIQFLKVVKLIDLHHLCTRDASNVAPSAVFEKVSRLLQEPRKAGSLQKSRGKRWSMVMTCYLVGGCNPSEKYESQWEGLSIYSGKKNACSKPPNNHYKLTIINHYYWYIIPL